MPIFLPLAIVAVDITMKELVAMIREARER